ncbi:MORN repeat protein [Chlamydia pneumoniae LPCoLN]|uniref:toxin-antitoxin system YwqK family antitoxin n=1 Tax=Chlamydia pneumoniae TaxID=83558 RepID=UPI0001BD9D18|nr:toxin-antitoxin system YwqK family antitoxin [Chlamydia pneumoniae]ACZ32653.1 MORN repeat protein [Chlamydia pneumoniae LPCoLN]ETR79511.1 Phophatidylinositol-4-phosphate 5-kinase [Chlamydia pneumoniae B21]
MDIKKLFCLFLCSSLIAMSPIYGKTGDYEKLTLTGINIIDRNGLSETICSKEKLKKYTKVDFLAPQPYQKVMRMYKNKRGDNVSCLTAYHTNGQIKQYLECLNNRAYGRYREWHVNGNIKIQAEVIGGIADLHPSAESGWLFDQTTFAYNDEGILEAAIVYEKGLLEGSSVYYHTNGNIWKECPYHKGVPQGKFLTYTSSGKLLKEQNYQQGKRHGLSIRYSEDSEEDVLAWEEYHEGRLLKAEYLDPQTHEIYATIHEGNGIQAIYGKYAVIETRAFYRGEPYGKVSRFDNSGTQIVQTYNLLQGAKHGEEFFFYPETGKPKLLLNWHEGILHGIVKTWYPGGTLESCKELVNNKKSGLLTIYYPEGQIMATEEYDNDLLIKGEYFRPGDRHPYSKIDRGCGTAVFFSSAGTITKKIPYQDGKPLLN